MFNCPKDESINYTNALIPECETKETSLYRNISCTILTYQPSCARYITFVRITRKSTWKGKVKTIHILIIDPEPWKPVKTKILALMEIKKIHMIRYYLNILKSLKKEKRRCNGNLECTTNCRSISLLRNLISVTYSSQEICLMAFFSSNDV